MSTAFPETLPAAWVSRLESLADDAPARPWDVTKRTIERELGRPLGAVFQSFDVEPIAAASVGQVHKARLPSGEVAVKVMFPGVEHLIMSDLNNIRRVLRLVKPALLPAVDEFRERVKGEFDFRHEMRALVRVKRYLNTRRLDVIVPAVVPSLTTTRILVMDWLEGRSLRDTVRAEVAKALASSNRVQRNYRLFRLRRSAWRALAVVTKAYAAMIFDDGAFSCDPHPGNVSD